MIPFFDPSAAAGIMMLVLAQGCPPQQMPMVNINVVNTPPVYDNTYSSAELGEVPIDTKIARHSNEVFITGGLTRGQVTTAWETSFAKMLDERSGVACLWLKSVNLTLTYTPNVYIASEHRPGSCRYDVIMEHEIRHVNTDIMTLNEYLPLIQQNLQYAVDTLGVRGPYHDTQMSRIQQDMQDVISGRLRDTLAEMDAVRRKRQQMIDTRQEYMRLSGLCPDERMGTPRRKY